MQDKLIAMSLRVKLDIVVLSVHNRIDGILICEHILYMDNLMTNDPLLRSNQFHNNATCTHQVNISTCMHGMEVRIEIQ